MNALTITEVEGPEKTVDDLADELGDLLDGSDAGSDAGSDDESDAESDAGTDNGETGKDEDEDAPPPPPDAVEKPKKRTKAAPKKKRIVQESPEEDDDDDDDEDTSALTEMNKDDYLQTHHPEVIFPDSAEMESVLASYSSDTNPVKRISRPILSKYEAASIVGMRSQQIVQGSAPLVDVPTDDPIEIAQAELKAKIIPIVVRRILPDGKAEYWRLSELRYYD